MYFHVPKKLRMGLDRLQMFPAEINKLKSSRIRFISDKGLESTGIVREVEKLHVATKTQFTKFTGTHMNVGNIL